MARTASSTKSAETATCTPSRTAVPRLTCAPRLGGEWGRTSGLRCYLSVEPTTRPSYTAAMCGRFTLTEENRDRVAALLGVPVEELVEESYRPRWNIAPMQEHWIARERREERHAVLATWGLVNGWSSRGDAARHINARAETLAERPAFREAFESGRCIVPADGFFEWATAGRERRPYWFHRTDGQPLLFAGLASDAPLPRGGTQTTFTIVTTEASADVAAVYDRMPVILGDQEAADAWLYSRQAPRVLRDLLGPAPTGVLLATPVSSRVNSVEYDDPDCLRETAPPAEQARLL
ncbi:MAG: SOS response-associated peptidase [Dehalococcoidia bacterium]|nr:SOS response-associated peptidase [Dehalococcoidia bacterium]